LEVNQRPKVFIYFKDLIAARMTNTVYKREIEAVFPLDCSYALRISECVLRVPEI
jgi:hypothetical protein